jgi:hypothetical protein
MVAVRQDPGCQNPTAIPSTKAQACNHRQWSRAALLGHTKIESNVRYLAIEADDALAIADQADV